MKILKIKIVALITLLTLSFSASAQIDRSVQPAPGPAPVIKLGKADTFTLKNGLQVIMVENHKLPRVSASLTIDNKPYFEGDKAGITQLLSSLLGSGTKNITKDEFNEKVDFLGASVSLYSSGASANSLKKYFPEILELMADGVKNAVFTQEEFDKQMDIILENLKSDEKSVTANARRVESALLYGKNHPYGEFTTKETLKNISLSDVNEYYQTYYKPNNAYLIIVGDINPKETKKLVSALFSDWQQGTIPVATFPSPTNVAATEINFINMPNAVQSEIMVGNVIDLKLGDKDYYAALLANSILGGGGTARLFMNLREDKGYTYGSYSSIGANRYVGSFKAKASVRNMVTDSSVVEILKEINKIRYQKVTEEELKNAKAEYVGSFVMNVQKPATAASFALNIARYKLPKDFYEKYLENINKVTVEDVQNVAYNYFKGNKARIVITGKASEVLKNLEKLNYKISYFDTQANATSKPEMNLPIPTGVTAQSVVDDYVNAIGGKEKVEAIKTLSKTSSASIQGIALQMTQKSSAPNKMSITITGMGQVFQKIIFNGENGYQEAQGQRKELDAKEIEKFKTALSTFNELSFAKGNLKRIENIDGQNAYVIVLDDKEAYFNVNTKLLIKEIETAKTPDGKEVKVPKNFSNYKEVNGVKFPFKTSSKMGPMDLIFETKEIKINEGVSEADFQ